LTNKRTQKRLHVRGTWKFFSVQLSAETR
jgi:hypothetical protein